MPSFPATPTVLVIMGVSGSGKTTVATRLAEILNWPLAEGDALHPAGNIAKMQAGQPLTDADRGPWLEKVREWVQACLDAGHGGVITCSALKRAYRQQIARRGAGVTFVHLSGARDVIASRLRQRAGHFMPPALLDSQFAALEVPADDEPVLRVDVGASPAAIAAYIVQQLGLVSAPVKQGAPD